MKLELINSEAPKIDTMSVRRLARIGLDETAIASRYGLSCSEFRQLCDTDKRIGLAYRQGQSEGIEDIASALYESAMDGNVRAAELFLKCRAGWRDTGAGEDVARVPVIEVVLND